MGVFVFKTPQSGRAAKPTIVPGLGCLVEVRSILHFTMSVDLVKHTGGCHCGKVRFEVLAKSELRAYDCK